MRYLRSMLAAASLLFAGGCATDGWQASDVPVPRTTPYDSNQMVRAAYLDAFRQGYLAQKDGGPASVDVITGPYELARQQGFNAGVAQARADGSTGAGAPMK